MKAIFIRLLQALSSARGVEFIELMKANLVRLLNRQPRDLREDRQAMPKCDPYEIAENREALKGLQRDREKRTLRVKRLGRRSLRAKCEIWRTTESFADVQGGVVVIELGVE